MIIIETNSGYEATENKDNDENGGQDTERDSSSIVEKNIPKQNTTYSFKARVYLVRYLNKLPNVIQLANIRIWVQP